MGDTDTLYKKTLQVSFTIEGKDILYKAGQVIRFEDYIWQILVGELGDTDRGDNITDRNIRVLAEDKV